MEERLKELRKQLKLSQKDFGNKLGVGDTAISKIEKGENKLSYRMALSICSIFNVNIDWLLEGKGDIFVSLPNLLFDQISEKYELDDFDRKLLRSYMELSPEERKTVKKIFNSLKQ